MHAARLSAIARDEYGVEVPDGAIIDAGDSAFAVVDGVGFASTDADASAVLLQAARLRPGRVGLICDDAGVASRRFGASSMQATVHDRTGGIAAAVPLGPSSPSVEIDGLDLFESIGLDVFGEHGVVRGEVLGLLVARYRRDGELEIGVGEVDMEASALLQRRPPAERLAAVVEEVRRHRKPGGSHPINRLARARWLRRSVLTDPDLVSADRLVAVEPIAPPVGVRDETPSCATSGDGRLVACISEVSLSLLPEVLDQIVRRRPSALCVACPARDAVLVARLTDGFFSVPSSVVGITPPW